MPIPFATPVPYLALLTAVNPGLAGIRNFDFHPGMLFGSRDKWWPDSGVRPTAHEGIDICYYTDAAGRRQRFSPRIVVPVMASGRIFAFCRDFLGRSVFIDHGVDDGRRFLAVYAHIVPQEHLALGQEVEVGEVVGTVADTTGRKNRMPVHVHITLMRIPEAMTPDRLDWTYICSSAEVELIDPLTAIDRERVTIHPDNFGKSAGEVGP